MSERALALHANPWLGVFFITGGGSPIISEILSTPGASRSVLEITVPYAYSSLTRVLGRAPEQPHCGACSGASARALAMAALQRALVLAPGEDPDRLFGLGCTASLATDRPKRGGHRAHIALQTAWRTHAQALTLTGDRACEEAALTDALWRLLQEALHEEPGGCTLAAKAQAGWRALVLGAEQAVATQPHDGRLLLPGAFNPLHEGHRAMLEVAQELTGLAGAFELSIANVDKPALDYVEIERRLAQFNPGPLLKSRFIKPVWLSSLPTFLAKARCFPGAVFAVGVDTIERIDAPRYYGGAAGRDRAIGELAALGCRFVVFGRVTGGRFQSLDRMDLSHALRRLCQAVPEARFRQDISSTQLRANAS